MCVCVFLKYPENDWVNKTWIITSNVFIVVEACKKKKKGFPQDEDFD